VKGRLRTQNNWNEKGTIARCGQGKRPIYGGDPGDNSQKGSQRRIFKGKCSYRDTWRKKREGARWGSTKLQYGLLLDALIDTNSGLNGKEKGKNW